MNTFRIEKDRFAIGGPPVTVHAEAAGTLLMTVHELATNALKHGALSREGGTICVDWETRADGVRIRWRERNGPPARPPRRKSLGLVIMESGIEKQLGGTLRMDWSEAGVTCDIVLPATHIVG